MPEGPKGRKQKASWPVDLERWRARPTRKHVSLTEKRALKAAAVQFFVKKYGRKAQKGAEPNDRRYDKKFEERLKRMSPEDLDRLLREDED